MTERQPPGGTGSNVLQLIEPRFDRSGVMTGGIMPVGVTSVSLNARAGLLNIRGRKSLAGKTLQVLRDGTAGDYLIMPDQTYDGLLVVMLTATAAKWLAS